MEKTYIDANSYHRFKDSNTLIHRYVMEKEFEHKLKPGNVVHYKNPEDVVYLDNLI